MTLDENVTAFVPVNVVRISVDYRLCRRRARRTGKSQEQDLLKAHEVGRSERQSGHLSSYPLEVLQCYNPRVYWSKLMFKVQHVGPARRYSATAVVSCYLLPNGRESLGVWDRNKRNKARRH
jgi:hypothetical protein